MAQNNPTTKCPPFESGLGKASIYTHTFVSLAPFARPNSSRRDKQVLNRRSHGTCTSRLFSQYSAATKQATQKITSQARLLKAHFQQAAHNTDFFSKMQILFFDYIAKCSFSVTILQKHFDQCCLDWHDFSCIPVQRQFVVQSNFQSSLNEELNDLCLEP